MYIFIGWFEHFITKGAGRWCRPFFNLSAMAKGIGGHQSSRMQTSTWLTPPHILQALGSFDLDPCASLNRPWDTALHHYTIADDGLSKDWFGRVWLNPPYGNQMGVWLKKMAEHMDGVTLIFARTETKVFQQYIFEKADSILFIKNRLTFYTADGKPGRANGGAPSVLVAYGEKNIAAIDDSEIPGKHLLLNRQPVVVIGISPSWKSVVTIVLQRVGKDADLRTIYEQVDRLAPDKIRANRHHKEKIRQTLRRYFTRVGEGRYSLQ